LVVGKVRAEKKNVGYNAATRQIEDLFEAGIIDPAKVVRAALQNAASIAGLLLTTDGRRRGAARKSGLRAGRRPRLEWWRLVVFSRREYSFRLG